MIVKTMSAVDEWNTRALALTLTLTLIGMSIAILAGALFNYCRISKLNNVGWRYQTERTIADISTEIFLLPKSRWWRLSPFYSLGVLYFVIHPVRIAETKLILHISCACDRTKVVHIHFESTSASLLLNWEIFNFIELQFNKFEFRTEFELGLQFKQKNGNILFSVETKINLFG